MVPSPRKRVTRASFNQTWDDTDAALLDPSSLPVARIPRGWERKQETKKTEEGRAKKIWRRVNLRSRAPETTEEEDDEEEHDARSRATKRRQHMSPEAMEKTTAKLNGKTRAFKGTRWDRRKSVLPRKKATRAYDSTADDQDEAAESDDAQDATAGDRSYETFADTESVLELSMENVQNQLPAQKDRRSTFTFTMDAEASEGLAHDRSLVGMQDDTIDDAESAPAEDATLMNFFRSPMKQTSASPLHLEQIAYPQLPLSDNDRGEHETNSMAMDDGELVAELGIDKNAEEPVGSNSNEEEEIVTAQEAVRNEADQEEADIADADTLDHVDSVSEPFSPAVSAIRVQQASDDIAYPALPLGSSPRADVEPAAEEVQEVILAPEAPSDREESVDINMEDGLALGDGLDTTAADEEFTEASLQLNIQQDYEQVAHGEQPMLAEAMSDVSASGEPEDGVLQDTPEEVTNLAELSEEDGSSAPYDDEPTQTPGSSQIADITDGLTLSFTPARAPSVEPTPRKLHSPPPPPAQSSLDDATMTIALDDDTALLKDFLNRAAASKAEKAAVMTHRRESLQNRRDSDVIRHALSSPRKALEEKDPNSPSKYDNELTLDLSQTLTLSMDNNNLASPTPNATEGEDLTDEKSLRGSRRSSRAKKSRLPAPASAAQTQPQTSKIAIRRADGTEHVVLKKSDAQELSLLTRANTRKNKQGAFGVTVRLMKLAADAANLPPLDDSTREIVIGKNIRWDEQLAYYQENPETVAEAESLATPDELGMSDAVSTPSAKPKSKVSKNSTPKVRRARGLGTANGTPAKALLAPTPFDDEEKDATPAPAASTAQQLPRPKASKIRKMTVASASQPESKLPSLDIAPVGVEPTKERKSRLAAPKKVMLPQSVATLPAEGKENTQRSGLGGVTPKKGIPTPKVIVPPTVGMESGLPRRRGRKI
ncbi:hypothetical protein HBH70_047460 [Parastagonospora nodorum]|nr:hypothetical protein HBH53_082330 [Parastagonospora nodorum]KAH4066310.1 hypothetical protein HBH50_147490 [Parastagonospora nodorum]KAH4089391.1 hypothetical protein HBH48_112590 [Parastagonospora nodorum]KAH4108754.1 hypothetical protein HBH46_036500 [Parastagonospora nodorum]KAH4212463.1 hypothetical protein HBI95_037710 [Parastagonospora nodorum]